MCVREKNNQNKCVCVVHFTRKTDLFTLNIRYKLKKKRSANDACVRERNMCAAAKGSQTLQSHLDEVKGNETLLIFFLRSEWLYLLF